MDFTNIDNKSLEHPGCDAHSSSEISSLRMQKFFCVTKTYKVFLVALFAERCGLLRGRFQANCLGIFNLLAGAQTMRRSP